MAKKGHMMEGHDMIHPTFPAMGNASPAHMGSQSSAVGPNPGHPMSGGGSMSSESYDASIDRGSV